MTTVRATRQPVKMPHLSGPGVSTKRQQFGKVEGRYSSLAQTGTGSNRGRGAVIHGIRATLCLGGRLRAPGWRYGMDQGIRDCREGPLFGGGVEVTFYMSIIVTYPPS